MIKFPYARPDITKEDKKEVFNSLNNQFLTGGLILLVLSLLSFVLAFLDVSKFLKQLF